MNWKLPLVLYIAGGVTTSSLVYDLHRSHDAAKVPAAYIAVGLLWPAVGFITTAAILAGKSLQRGK